MTALEELRLLRLQEKDIQSRIEKITEQAANEAQAFTDCGKFEFLGHNYILDHVDYYRVKVLD